MIFVSCLLSVVRCEKGTDKKIAGELNIYRFWIPEALPLFDIAQRKIYLLIQLTTDH